MPEPIPMSPEEYERLQARLEHLKTEVRPHARREVTRTREFGDLRENAEYHEARRWLSTVDGQVAALEQMVSRVVLVEGNGSSSVAAGALVAVTDLASGRALRLSVQAGGRAEPPTVTVTPESPMGKALLGRTAHDEVEVETPAGTRRYRIDTVEFL